MKVFRTSLFFADVEKTLHRRRVRNWRPNYVLETPGRKRTSGKLSYGPKVGRPLNVRSICDVLWTTLAEWVIALVSNEFYIYMIAIGYSHSNIVKSRFKFSLYEEVDMIKRHSTSYFPQEFFFCLLKANFEFHFEFHKKCKK